MLSLTVIGSFLLTALGFIIGKMTSETEKILSEKRSFYLDYLSVIPDFEKVHKFNSEEKLDELTREIKDRFNKLVFYADERVLLAYENFYLSLYEARNISGLDEKDLSKKYDSLVRSKNDLVHQMRRDAFRWSVFGYRKRQMMQPVAKSKS